MEEMTVKEEAKRIPYGMMNFVAVREDTAIMSIRQDI